MKTTIILFSICAFLLSGCQLPTANYTRDQYFPEETGSKVALSPVLLPTYIILCIFDVIIINPLRGTNNVPAVSVAIWEWQKQPPWLGYGALLPVKAVGIPTAAVGTVMFSEQFSGELGSPNIRDFSNK